MVPYSRLGVCVCQVASCCAPPPPPPFCTFADRPTCCSLSLSLSVSLPPSSPPLCRQDRIPNFVSVSQQVRHRGAKENERTEERADGDGQTDGQTDGRRSIFNLDLPPAPPPPSDDTNEPRPRSFSRRVPMSRAPRVGLAVSPRRRLQETARSARSRSHYCAMGTYHFALPTRRHLALHIGANEQEQGRKSLFAFYRFLKLGIFYLVVSEGERERYVYPSCVCTPWRPPVLFVRCLGITSVGWTMMTEREERERSGPTYWYWYPFLRCLCCFDGS